MPTSQTTTSPDTTVVSLTGLTVALEEIAKVYATKQDLNNAGLGDVTFATEEEIRALFTTTGGETQA